MAEDLGLLRFPEGVAGDDYVVATYYLETPLELHSAANALAAEQSTGTWMRVHYETEERRRRHGAKVIGVYPLPYSPDGPSLPSRPDQMDTSEGINAGMLRIAFPWINFGPLLPNLLSTVAGNLYEMGAFAAVKLLDLEFPAAYTDQFSGPRFGSEGTRRLLGVTERPLLGAIVKPCVGLSVDEIADLAYQASRGGLDFIKDDELMADVAYNPIKERAVAVTQALRRAEEETGHKTMYAFNITDRVDRMRELHDAVVEAGGICVMVNVATLGYQAMKELAEFAQVPIHCHRDFAPSYTRSQYTGMSAEVLTKICRLAGADQMHCGAVGGKLYETDDEVLVNVRACQQEFHHVPASLPVSSGGQWAGKLARNVKTIGHVDFLHLSGGGVFAHPSGAEAGARSLRQAWDAIRDGVPLETYAREHAELREALDFFGR